MFACAPKLWKLSPHRCFQINSTVVNRRHFLRLIFTAGSVFAFVSLIHRLCHQCMCLGWLFFFFFRGKWSYFCQIFCFTVQLDEVWAMELFQSRKIKLSVFWHSYLNIEINPNSIIRFFIVPYYYCWKYFMFQVDCVRIYGLVRCEQYWWTLVRVFLLPCPEPWISVKRTNFHVSFPSWYYLFSDQWRHLILKVSSVGARKCGLFKFLLLKGKPFKLNGKRIPVIGGAQNLIWEGTK